LGPKGILDYAKRNGSRWVVQFPALTNTLLTAPERIERIESAQLTQTQALEQLAHESRIARHGRRTGATLGVLGLIAAGLGYWDAPDLLLAHWPWLVGVLSLVLIVRR
jgi:hypothetical protein